MGSIGREGDAETAGGGRIVLLLDSADMNGWGSAIQANSMPFGEEARESTYQLVGGSGGYIYLKTTNALNTNAIG
jgi:hypothetical protein